MLASVYLLKKESDINQTKVNGILFRSENLNIKILKKNNLELPKFAFIVSKKISKSAVVRNRIKRLLAEIVRKNLEKITNGYNFVFLTKSSILNLDRDKVIKEVERIINIKFGLR